MLRFLLFECIVLKITPIAHQYAGIHGPLWGIHQSKEPGCDNRRVNDTFKYDYSTCGGCCHDQCGAHSGSPQVNLVKGGLHGLALAVVQVQIFTGDNSFAFFREAKFFFFCRFSLALGLVFWE